MVKIQAREIIRAAKRNNVKINRFDYNRCVVGVIGHMVGLTWDNYADSNVWGWEREVATKAGLSMNNMRALEAGFEGWDRLSPTNNRYYKVGKRVAELAGL